MVTKGGIHTVEIDGKHVHITNLDHVTLCSEWAKLRRELNDLYETNRQSKRGWRGLVLRLFGVTHPDKQSVTVIFNDADTKDYINTYDRLKEALTLLGYSDAAPVHHRSNLLHAIQQFAAQHNDTDLEARCEAEIVKIRASNTIK
ncbi:hypothetical protein [Shewanella sp. LC2]|uniref:hypothetical protein n=1 Tax=Shewanella sp. LC2 TaxID=2589789 RepID=UPI001F06EBB2|nr:MULTISPECIES: hypothetical protein [unclassified Shewanella]